MYAGEMESRKSVLWEKGPNNKVFLRVVTTISVADSVTDIFKAVSNSNMNPIAFSFDIKALGKDSSSVVLEGINSAIVGIIWASGIILFRYIAFDASLSFEWFHLVVAQLFK